MRAVNEALWLIQPRAQATPASAQLKTHRLRSSSAIRLAVRRLAANALWVAPSEGALRLLVGALAHRLKGDQTILSLKSMSKARSEFLRSYFRTVLSADEGVHLLPTEELMNALSAANRAELIIGGAASDADDALILYRGDLERIVVPFNWFTVGPASRKPNFAKLAIVDGGQTVRLGDYEAAVDAILYEFDPQYRGRAKKRLAERDDSLGGALRRLRLQKGLRQSDFASVGAKVIARIERGEVRKPHQKTMVSIAKRLGVSPEEIATF